VVNFVEIIGLIFGGSSAVVGLAGLISKLIGTMRGYDRQLEALRHGIAEAQLESERQRSQIREHLLKLEAALDMLRTELGVKQSIESSPRFRSHSRPIETDI
jgi:hypothetical protein